MLKKTKRTPTADIYHLETDDYKGTSCGHGGRYTKDIDKVNCPMCVLKSIYKNQTQKRHGTWSRKKVTKKSCKRR